MNKKVMCLIDAGAIMSALIFLAIFALPRITTSTDHKHLTKVKNDFTSIQNALYLFRIDNGFYPTTRQGLRSLVTKPVTDEPLLDWRPYMTAVPQDPWHNDYHYSNHNSVLELHSDVPYPLQRRYLKISSKNIKDIY